MAIHVTDTQKLIVKTALNVTFEDAEEIDELTLEAIIRAMLVIERAGMQPYFFKGFRWSCWSRAQGNHAKAEADFDLVDRIVACFHDKIFMSGEKAASRIRANRIRRIKAIGGRDMQMRLAEARYGREWYLHVQGADLRRLGIRRDRIERRRRQDGLDHVA